jgi:FAD/FMN-containing dehydrogenase
MKREVEDLEFNTIHAKALELLQPRLRGALVQPSDLQYEVASKAWNLNAHQHPALVVIPEHVEDILATVQFANGANIGVGILATGHGVGSLCNGGILINTSKMRGVIIDPITQTAKVEVGALWKDVIPAAHVYGLASLAGSAPHVGVVGYTLGGGFGYLGRKYGLNSSSAVAADIVTAEGKILHVNDHENPELFWALKGSGGNFGIVTSLEFKLYPLQTVYGGAVFYPVESAHTVLSHYAHWSANLPDEVTTAFAFMNIPPLPFLPEALRGKSVVVIKGCYCGEVAEHGEELFKSVRQEIGQAIVDTFGVMSVTAMDTISKDPVEPMGVLQYGGMLADLSPEVIDAFVNIAGAGSGSPLLMLEFRLLGGALQHNPQNISLMGNGRAKFSVNALGATFTAEMAERVSTYLTRLADNTQQFQTGETFLNFMEVAPTEDRVRSAYTQEDWDRLVSLKAKYDPLNIFRFNRNIPPRF